MGSLVKPSEEGSRAKDRNPRTSTDPSHQPVLQQIPPKSRHRTKHCSFMRWVVVVVSERPAGRLPRVSSTDCGAGTGNFDQDQGAMRRGCNDCKVGPGRPLSYESLRDEVRSFCRSPVRQPDDAVSLPRTLALFGTLRQSRRFSSFSRRLCCERTCCEKGPSANTPERAHSVSADRFVSKNLCDAARGRPLACRAF